VHRAPHRHHDRRLVRDGCAEHTDRATRIAAQAVDLRPAEVRASLGTGARRIYDGVRERVAILDDDRSLAPDFEAVAAWLARGE